MVVEQLVIVRAAGPGRFTAQALGVPEIRAEADTEAAALDQVRESLAGRVVRFGEAGPDRRGRERHREPLARHLRAVGR
jgi:hypothetical protein